MRPRGEVVYISRMDAPRTPSGKDYLLLAMAGCLLAAIPISAFILSKWVFLGAGLFAGLIWIWIRSQTGVWVDDLDGVKISISPAPDQEGSPSQRQEG